MSFAKLWLNDKDNSGEKRHDHQKIQTTGIWIQTQKTSTFTWPSGQEPISIPYRH